MSATEEKVPAVFKKRVPPVSKKLMRDAITRYHEMEDPGSYEKMLGVGSSLTLGPLTSPKKPRSGSRRFIALSHRFTALHYVLEQHKAKILERESFPAVWGEIAAVAELRVVDGFDAAVFTWAH